MARLRSVAASQLEGAGLNPELRLLSVRSFTCPPSVCVNFLPPPKNMSVSDMGVYVCAHDLESYPGCIPASSTVFPG